MFASSVNISTNKYSCLIFTFQFWNQRTGMNLECYHTLEDRENPDEVENRGPFVCTRGDFWFGKGYYFWDTNVEWAHNWGEWSYGEERYIICQATIKLDNNIFDLTGNVSHKMAFMDAYDIIIKKNLISGRKLVLRDVIYYK